MNNIERQYQQLLGDILENGVDKKDRTGTGTLSVFGRQIRHKMSEGFPLLTTKKMAWKTMVTELLWFLRGDTNIKYLVDNACHIWDGDAYKNYCNQIPKYSKQFTMSKEEYIEKIKTDDEFAKKWGDLGPIYGRQWRNWSGIDREFWINTDNNDDPLVGGHGLFYQPSEIDQITNLINELKTNPDSRRLMVSAWNVGQLDEMVLPPCHYGFQLYTREENGQRYISLMWNQRSVDTFLGLPFNIASYGLLLEIIAKEVNMVPDELIGNLGDVHLYKNHIEQAKEQMYRRPYDLPKVQITERNWYQHELVKEHLGEKTFSEKIMSYRPDCFELIGYQSHDKIKAPLSN
jgi:thymidylate synthase